MYFSSTECHQGFVQSWFVHAPSASRRGLPRCLRRRRHEECEGTGQSMGQGNERGEND